MHQSENLERLEKAKELLARVQDEPIFVKTKPAQGYFIWQRNDHLTLKKGPLEHPWRKKVDEVSRTYLYY